MDDASYQAEELEQSEQLEGKEPKKADRRASPEYWFRWIRAAKKAAKPHWDDAKAAWKEYENKGKIQVENSPGEKIDNVYPIYYSSVKTLEPAYYGRTPKIASRRLFDVDDPTALTMSLISDRVGSYLAENGDFDPAMLSGVADFIHADKASLQLVYDLRERTERRLSAVAPTVLPDGSSGYIDDRGKPAKLVGEPTLDPTNGALVAEVEETIIEEQKIRLAAASYDEILHTPNAKSWAEITELAIKFCMGEDEALERFGTDKDGNARALPWKTNKGFERADDEKERDDLPGRYLEGWEVWCLHSKRVYWVSEDYHDGFLDEKEDPYKLRGFFPVTPFIIGSKPSKDLYPTPAYMQVKPVVDQLHGMFDRMMSNLSSIRRRALVDDGGGDIVAALNSDDQEYVAVQNAQLIRDKGGIANMMWFIPVAEFVAALGELGQLEDRFKNLFFEWFGVPEIIRGGGDPIETAAGLEIKSGAANDRFKWMKKQVQQMARGGLEMMLDLALQVFDDEKIARICGYQYLEEEHKARFFEALSALRTDSERIVRIDIETDSTSFANDTVRLQQQKQIADTVISGLSTIGGMQNPEFAGSALRVLLKTLAAMPGASKDFEDGIRSEVKAITEKKSKPEDAPPPDAAMLRVQVDQQRLQLDTQVKMRELDQKDFKLQLDQQKQQADGQLKSMALEFQRQVESLYGALEQQRLQLEQFKTQLAEREMVAEESRLAYEAETNAARAVQQEPTTRQPAASVTIVNAPQATNPFEI